MEKILDQSWHCWVAESATLEIFLRLWSLKWEKIISFRFNWVWVQVSNACFGSRTVVLARIPLCDRTDTTYFTLLALTSETRGKPLLERHGSGGTMWPWSTVHEAELPSDWVKGGIVLPSLVTLFKIIILFIYLFLAILGLHCFVVFSLVAASRGYSLAVVHGLLIAVASLAAEHGL